GPQPPVELEPPAPAPAATSVEQRTPVSSQPPGRASVTSSTLAEIHGRFVFPGGAPAAGVSIEMHGWQSNQERVLQFGEPEDWVDPQAETDADGRFTVSFDPPRA